MVPGDAGVDADVSVPVLLVLSPGAVVPPVELTPLVPLWLGGESPELEEVG